MRLNPPSVCVCRGRDRYAFQSSFLVHVKGPDELVVRVAALFDKLLLGMIRSGFNAEIAYRGQRTRSFEKRAAITNMTVRIICSASL